MQAIDMRATEKARLLRRKIQAIRIKRLGWSDYVFHSVMSGLGFGTSLTALDETQLETLFNALDGYRKHGKPAEFDYDKWGRYMHAMMLKAGWDENMLRQYLTVTYQKTHWNVLNKAEKRAVVKLLQGLGEGDK